MADAENEVVFLDNENNTITRIIVLQRLALIKSIICILYVGHCMLTFLRFSFLTLISGMKIIPRSVKVKKIFRGSEET